VAQPPSHDDEYNGVSAIFFEMSGQLHLFGLTKDEKV